MSFPDPADEAAELEQQMIEIALPVNTNSKSTSAINPLTNPIH